MTTLAPHLVVTELADSTDCDRVVDPGKYSVVTPGNGPSGDNFIIEVLKTTISGISVVMQRAFAQSTNGVYVRFLNAGAWTTWTQAGGAAAASSVFTFDPDLLTRSMAAPSWSSATAATTHLGAILDNSNFTGLEDDAIPYRAQPNIRLQPTAGNFNGGNIYTRDMGLFRAQGFRTRQRFAVGATLQPNHRIFVGLSSGGIVLNNPTTNDNLIGLYLDANADPDWQILSNATGTSQTPVNGVTGFTAVAGQFLEVCFYSEAGGAGIEYKVTNLADSAEYSGEITSELPTATPASGESLSCTTETNNGDHASNVAEAFFHYSMAQAL